MTQVLNATDFAAARAIKGAKLNELGWTPVCMAPGEMNPGHSHTIVEEMLVVQKGMGKIQIENDTYDLCAGSVAVVPAGKFHALCNTGTENLEGVIVFNSNYDRDKVVLKTREEHFGCADEELDLAAQIKALRKENKKLRKLAKRAM
ncbi:MAG: cupin domain-containing protein [Proteobacteria bacterium]|nr:cupin domain-containing protein [Pseudomonadota bacterium]